MTCIHGLDEISCPTCSIMRSTMPMKKIYKKEEKFLKIKNPFFKKNSSLKDEFVKELTKNRINPKFAPINSIPKLRLINEIPDFGNRMFMERIKDLNLDNGDLLGIPKKIPLENPEWKNEKDD